MTIRQGAETGITSRGSKLPPDDFTLAVTLRDNIISGTGTTLGNDLDAVVQNFTTATVDHEADIEGVFDVGNDSVVIVGFDSDDDGIATADANGVVTRVSDGTIAFRGVNDRGRKALTPPITVSRSVGVTAQSFLNFRTGSLAKHCWDNIDTRIAGKTKAANALIHDGVAYSPNRWVAGIDQTGVSRGIPRATLITPQHILSAEHFFPTGTVTFLQEDGTIVSRTIVQTSNVGPANGSDLYATDLRVGLLDSPVPAGVKHYKILPADVDKYMPSFQYGIPALSWDQEEKALIVDTKSVSTGRFGFAKPTDSQRLEFYEDKVQFDSGSPQFLLVDLGSGVENILISTLTFGGAGGGPAIHLHASEIDAAILATDVLQGIATGFSATVADLSGFPDYTSYQEIVKVDSPLAYWRLGESSGTVAADASSHGHQGTYIGSLTLGQPGALAADSDTAIELPGLAGRYVDTPLIIDPTLAVTIEVWVMLTINPVGDLSIISQHDGSGIGRTLLFVKADKQIATYLGGALVVGGGTLSLSTWHHVVFTYAGGTNGTYQFYLDGVAKNSGTLTGEAADGGVVLGIHKALSINPFHGFMDEAAIYATALPASRVLAHYNAGAGV